LSGKQGVPYRSVERLRRLLAGLALTFGLHSAKATASSFYAGVNVLLPPGEQHHLPIIEFPRHLDKPSDTSRRWVCFLISWRKTSSTWLPQFPIPAITPTHDIERISAATPKQN
jgi:hypothetical protein